MSVRWRRCESLATPDRLGFTPDKDSGKPVIPDEVRSEILARLKKTEVEHAVGILFAVESGSLDVPVSGGSVNGAGTLLASDAVNGKPIIERFVWTRPHTDAPRWVQSFLPDGGQTWEDNWIMDYTRRRL